MAHTYMPIMHRSETVATIPWIIFTDDDEAWAQKNHTQSLAELAGRGGLGICELIAILDHRAWRKDLTTHAWWRLWEIIAERGVKFQPRT